jgi:hypothetical protein
MLDQFIESRETVRRLRSGGLGAHLDSFAVHLAKCGYAAPTARSQLTLLGHFDQWMARRRLGLGDVTDELVSKFVDDRARSGSCTAASQWRSITFSPISAHSASSPRRRP